MRFGLSNLQKLDLKTWKFRAKRLDEYKKIDEILFHQKLPFIPEVLQTKLINRHHDDLLAKHFDINKRKELIDQKYYWSSLTKNIKAYMKSYNICLGFKMVKHKPISNL